jgi:dTDP-4-dehydrorhamnose reductase
MIILGATGMLGRQLVKLFPGWEKYSSKEFDFSKVDNIYRFANSLDPNDVVINACGLLRQHLSDDPTPEEYQRAFNLNCFLPQVLSWRCRLLHISTDCAMEGTKGNYTENDLPDGKDLYARSKSLGEAPSRAMVIRTSIIGKEDKNFKGLMAWFLSQTKANGFTNHMWNGMTTNELARCIRMIVDNDWWEPGLFHLYSNTVSKYDLLSMINLYRKNPATITPIKADKVVDRTLRTIHPEFMNRFCIRTLSDQIKEAMINE